jgi:hypothetical protein
MPSLEEDMRRLRKKYLDKEGIITLAVLVALIAGTSGFLIHKHHQDSARAAQELQVDKSRFAAMEKNMAAGYGAMTAGLEKPLNEQKGAKICDHTSQKFSKGDLYCSISYGFAYKVANYDAALARLNLLTQGLDSKVLQPDKDSLQSILADKSSTGYSQEQDQDIFIKNSQGFTCKLYMSIIKSSEADSYSLKGNERAATYAFSCLSNVKHPIYPLAQ